MRIHILAAIFAGLAFSSVHGASLTVDIDGVTQSYNLKSVNVDSTGNVSVAASVSANPTPTPTGSCLSSDTLTCVTTPLPQSAQSRLSYRPAASMVYAFKVTTPASGTYFNRVFATGMSGTSSSKLLVVSKVPGDVSIEGKDMGCYRLATESTSVQLAVNNASANKYLNCRLEPNTVYYVNAASVDFQGKPTCSSASTCGFYFEGS